VWTNSEKVAIAPIAPIVGPGPRDWGRPSINNPDIRDLIGAHLFDRLGIWPNNLADQPRGARVGSHRSFFAASEAANSNFQ